MNGETRNAEPEIGTDGSSQTQQNMRDDGYWSGFGLPSGSRSGLWMGQEPNRPVLTVRTQAAGRLPGPVANSNWVTPRIGITYLDNGTMNGHSPCGWILQFSNV